MRWLLMRRWTLADAMEALQTEHLFVSVNVYDAMGMMMEDASAELCLAENQFGYVILQGFEMMSWQEDISPSAAQYSRCRMVTFPHTAMWKSRRIVDKWSACAPTAGARGEAGCELPDVWR